MLVIGAGAIGGPLTLALAASGQGAGLSAIRLCDDDRVEASNLQRQVQFSATDIGRFKVERTAVRGQGRGVEIEPVPERFTEATADALASDVDLLIDGSDNFTCKFLVNDVARRAARPAIIASAVSTRGQVFVSLEPGPCYRCLFEEPPAQETGSCAQVGVLAPMPGMVAGAAAKAALALLAGAPPAGTLMTFPTANGLPRITDFAPRNGCPACGKSPNLVAS